MAAGDQQISHVVPWPLIQRLNSLGLATVHIVEIVQAWGPVATAVLQAMVERLGR